MPTAQLRGLARRYHTNLAAAEGVWKRQKAKVRPQKGKDRGKHSYRYLVGGVKAELANRAQSHRRE